MEIPRVDPYLIKWSADGVIAMATESVGIQFLSLDAKELLDAKVKWNRTRSPQFITERVIDLQWSSTLTSANGGCQLACVLDTGEVHVLECVKDDVRVVYSLEGTFSAACWMSDLLLLGDNEGSIHAYKDGQHGWSSKPEGGECRITRLVSSGERIGVAGASQQCWLVTARKTGPLHWETAVNAGTSHIISLAFIGSDLVVQQCGEVTVGASSFTLDSYLPGDLIVQEKEVAVVHTNGQVSGSKNFGVPNIEGDIVHTAVHPRLPMAAVLVGGNNKKSSDWEFPILSRQSVNLAVFPLLPNHEHGLPRRIFAASPASWLYLLMRQQRLLVEPSNFVAPTKVHANKLEHTLHEAFLSEWFDEQRVAWYEQVDSRSHTEHAMQQSIASILHHISPVTPIDKQVVAFYLNKPYTSFKIRGDFISEEFRHSDNSGATALAPVLTSANNRAWKRCAITGLPLVTLETRTSSDGCFTCYKAIPRLENDPEAEVQANPVADALLAAANFCIFTGSNWVDNT